MTEQPIQIVVAFDFSTSSNQALAYAIDLARRAGRRVFHFACIIPDRGSIAEVPQGHETGYIYAEQVQHALTARVEQAFAASDVPEAVQFFVHARFGDAAHELLVLARGVGATLVVVGGKPATPASSETLGKVAEAIVRQAECSVIVARPRTYADVALIPIAEVEHTPSSYHKPHRYSYEEQRVIQRPLDWPLF